MRTKNQYKRRQKKHPHPEPTVEQAVEEKPEQTVEKTRWSETNTSPKTQEGETFKGETAFWPGKVQTRTRPTIEGRNVKREDRQGCLLQSEGGKEPSDEGETEIFSMKKIVK